VRAVTASAESMRHPLRGSISRLHLAVRTARIRLTFIYGGLFLLAGTALLGITYALTEHAIGSVTLPGGARVLVNGKFHPPAPGTPKASQGSPAQLAQLHQIQTALVSEHNTDLHQLFVQSTITFVVVAVLAIGLGWIVAGRVLQPLRTITATARNISATDLHERLNLQGPDDEFKELGATLDHLFARLEASFESQRRFIANAAHELRSPLAEERAVLQVALADPNATVESLRTSCETLLACEEEQEQIIDALLALAISERGIERWEPLDLANVMSDAVLRHRDEATRRGVHISENIDPAPVSGDPALLERLAANLVDNALRYNYSGGKVEVTTGRDSGQAILTIANTGTIINPAEIDRLVEPFQRLGPDRTHHEDGLGLGLSIVRAITTAHHADIEIRARAQGGLDVKVRFPVLPEALTPLSQSAEHRPLHRHPVSMPSRSRPASATTTRPVQRFG
jgi:signal transduction histidine kinase